MGHWDLQIDLFSDNGERKSKKEDLATEFGDWEGEDMLGAGGWVLLRILWLLGK